MAVLALVLKSAFQLLGYVLSTSKLSGGGATR
jgi:hypothetical protein